MDDNNASDPWSQTVMEFDTIEALDTLMSPLRMRLLNCFRDPATVREVADRLDLKVTRLYRHVNRLVDNGFLVVVEERPKAKTFEKVYRAAGRIVRPSADFTARHGTDGTAELLRLSFRSVEAEVVAAAERNPELDVSGDSAVVSFTRLHLDGQHLTELVADVNDLVRRYGTRSGDIPVSFLSSVIPLSDNTTMDPAMSGRADRR